MKRHLALALIALFTITNAATAANEPVAVTIEISSIDELIFNFVNMGVGMGLPLGKDMIVMSAQQTPMIGNLANLDTKSKIRFYVFLPKFDAAGGPPSAPPIVMVMPVPPGGQAYVDGLKAGYGKAIKDGNMLHLTAPTVPGTPELFVEASGTRVFVGTGADATKQIRDRHAKGQAINAIPRLPGTVKFAVHLDAVWATLKKEITTATANMPVPPAGASGLPKGADPKEMIKAQIDFYDAFVKDVQTFGIGMKPGTSTLDIYNRIELKPGSTLARTLSAAGNKANRYEKILPSNGYFTVMLGGMQAWQEFVEPYAAFMRTMFKTMGDDSGAATDDMIKWATAMMSEYAGDMGMSVATKPDGKGIGMVQYFHLKDAKAFQKTFDEMMAQMNELYAGMDVGMTLDNGEKRAYRGASIMSMKYAIAEDAAKPNHGMAMAGPVMEKFAWEIATVGNDLVYTMGGQEFMNMAIDNLKTPDAKSFLTTKPFVSLIPKVKGIPASAYSLSLVSMLKDLLRSMTNVQPEILNAIPDGSGGIAGYSFKQNSSVASVTRVSYSEIKALVTSAQTIGPMITQLIMGGMMQGMGAEAQAVPEDLECRRNLQLIDAAKEQYGTFDAELKKGDPVDPDGMKEYFPGGVMPSCPSEGSYNVGLFGLRPRCSVEGHTMDR
jgi:hypothetical protein